LDKERKIVIMGIHIIGLEEGYSYEGVWTNDTDILEEWYEEGIISKEEMLDLGFTEKHLLELVEEINKIEREINKEWTCKKEQ
jgi:hypothetical protein